MKPEAKRNEEQRRRARARIHDTYKAVGVHLIPKGRMVQAPVPQQWLPARARTQSRSTPAGQESATGTLLSIEAEDMIGIGGMEGSQESTATAYRDAG